MKTRYLLFLLFTAMLSLQGCKDKTEYEKAEENVEAYAKAYFNWDFPAAANYASADTKQWLTFLASQVTSLDIEAIKEKKEAATVEVGSLDLDFNNESATATVNVENFLIMDSIGKKPHVCDEAKYSIAAVKENGKWKFSKPEISK